MNDKLKFRRRDGNKQCTGIKDENGNLIFEGDIIQSLHFKSARIGEARLRHHVFWSESIGGFAVRNLLNESFDLTILGNCTMATYIRNSDEIEIIGNIHDGETQ